MKSHIDEHYCLTSVKAAKVFAEVFANETIIIFQNDKANGHLLHQIQFAQVTYLKR